jgi:HEAT repeat protein
LPELIKVLTNSKNAEARIGAAHALELMGAQAAPAVNALISNISYRESYEVREAAVRALGAIGKEAKPSVHQLTIALETDFVVVRRAAAEVLGQIDDKSAVPTLAKALYGDDDGVNAFAARSIALLTDQKFPDMEGAGFSVDKDGVPFIVKAAKGWWEREGQYQDWTDAK